MSARVFLGETLVGELRPDLNSARTTFEFDATYAASASRPVLGRWFEDRRIEPPRTFTGAPLPNFYRNLLPEGALRKIVERRLGSSAIPEYTMLLRLGENLPGAVRIASDEFEPDPLEDEERKGRQPRDPYRFALTGAQPKLTLSEVKDRLTVPLERQDGYWIAKLGSPSYQRLVENEHVMLQWARDCGLDVPDHRVIHSSDIDNFPEDFERNQSVLLVRRFDRQQGGARIHQEDFAQILDIAPEDRYTPTVPDLGWVNYGSIGAVIQAICGDDDYREYLKRLAFMVLSGNEDAHIKNWAVMYPDGLKARLAPVYDFVSTIVYEHPRHPALRWLEPLEPTVAPAEPLEKVTMDDLLAVASYTQLDTRVLMDELCEFVTKVRTAWAKVQERAPDVVQAKVTAHLQRAALR